MCIRDRFGDGTRFVSFRPRQIAIDRKDKWGNVKESRMVPREKAAHAYRQTVRRKVDPALVEWSGAGVFNAKVFPLAPKKLHRIVVGYDTNLIRTDDGLAYELALPERTGDCEVEFNVRQFEGMKSEIAGADARDNGADWKQFEFCLLYTSPSPRDATLSRMPSSA